MQRYSGRLTDLDPRGSRLELCGLPLAALARQIALLMEGPLRGGKLAVLTPTPVEAEDFLGDLRFFWPGGETVLLPGFDRNPFMQKFTGVALAGERMIAARRLAGEGPLVLVTSVPAAIRRLPAAEEIEERSVEISAGEELDFAWLAGFLAEGGYRRVDQVEGAGDFSVRGGILDVFPAGRGSPVRLEFLGDYVDSIRSFRVEDQKSSGRLESVDITPVSQAPVNEDAALRAYEGLRGLAGRNGWLDLLWEPVASGFLEGSLAADFENWSPLFADNLVGFSGFLAGTGAVPVLYDPGRLRDAGEAAWLGLTNHFSRLAADERPHLPLGALYEEPEAFLRGIAGLPAGILAARESPLPGEPGEPGSSAGAGGRLVVFDTESPGILKNLPGLAGRRAGFLDPLVGKIRSLLGRGFRITLVLKNPEQKRRLVELLYEHDLSPAEAPRGKAPPESPLTGAFGRDGGPAPAVWTGPGRPSRKGGGGLSFAVGQLSGSFVAPYDFEAFISEEEIFAVRRVRRARATEEFRGYGSLSDLSPGDYVVHAVHGIGQYSGLSLLTMSTGYRGDFLSIAYRGGDMLYVPVESFGVVSKYVGADDRPPALDRLGSGSWERIKAKVKEDVKAVAQELLDLYARRKASEGRACPHRDGDFLNFEAAFPYEETPDQARAIEDVMRDLERPFPMDRLVCGDVGFGKTEVAIRAAYRVVADGRQAVVLVPTTILAEQHERSFRERLRDWPVNVASLTRFQRPAEQRAILEALRIGSLDILIGTHRILQKDVAFKDLGLLVVDEEHRFGVKDKERLKKLRANVDVLSMSATPIPRSLAMSMSGIRDMSIIRTPPVDRLSVITSLIRRDDSLVCEAIDRELARGGQVYFIHNRIGDIHLWVDRLQAQLPLVRFGVGHGQMKPAELEEMMARFWRREIDVWVTTTIVESGLDFPDANTIVIDQADRLGLAQLYQLRGRVGRSWEQAYCYLMVDDPDTLTADARKRLLAIMENAELGSGYQVAVHDLQIRGSGSVLGSAQHGQASLVGYEMYSRLVEEAVAELKDEPLPDDYEPEIVLGAPAFLPDSYAPDTRARIMLYRRLSKASSDEEIAEIEDELKDRFGPLPPEAENLLDLSGLKILVKSVRARRLEIGDTGLSVTFFNDRRNARASVLDKLVELAGDPVRRITLSPGGELFVPRFNLKVKTLGPVGAVRHFLEYLDGD
ncbi:MAG: transcription-repair coupling factor [Deltaproteobacteria bacterium]|jgi:transcription-repair coupling factor (superfamily II helicase)|nr:transcription-repair coupling factor [Deltaproteobacteria bacterium]